MKHLSLVSIAFLSLAVLLSCGGEAPKKTDKVRKEVKSKTKDMAKTATAAVTNSDTKEDKDAQTTPGATPEQLKKAKEMIASLSDEDIASVKAEKKFKMLCSACHGFTGDLNVNGAKDLTVSEASLEDRVAQVYFGKGLMTPFKGIMSDAEIVAVSKYLDTFKD